MPEVTAKGKEEQWLDCAHGPVDDNGERVG